MRLLLTLLPLATLAAPALAAPPSEPLVDEIRIPPALTDPVMIARIGNVIGSLSGAVLNLPIGELEAAVEGRPVTPSDRNRTIREIATGDDPDFERKLQRDIATSGVAAQAGIKAMASALPAIGRAASEARREIERATANLPSPAYPAR